MKSYLLTILFFAPLICCYAQSQQELIIKPDVKEVTLFLDGAQVLMREKINLKAGINKVIFKELSGAADASSVQLNADKDVIIMSVNYQKNYLEVFTEQEIKILKDSIKIYEAEIKRLESQHNAYNEEGLMLKANRAIGGSNIGVSVNELQKMADFIRLRNKEVGLKMIEIGEQMEARNLQISRLKMQANDKQTAKFDSETGEIIAMIKCDNAVGATLELIYFVSNCGWIPSYDIRATDVSKPLSIMAKATLMQKTGQNWNNVKLTLSTGNPAMGGVKPELNPWYVAARPYSVVKSRYKISTPEADKSMKMNADRNELNTVIIASHGVSAGRANRTAADFSNVNTEISTNALFEISLPYTLASDAKDKTLDIIQSDVSVNFIYAAVPKFDKDAFLVAEIVNWDKPEWLPGDANIYFEGNFVGKSYFDTRLTDDTLRLSIGRDNNIVIERKQQKDFAQSVSFLGNNKKVSRAYDITIRNKRNVPVVLMIEDQIPVASNDQVSVNLDKSDNAQFDKVTGKLVWRIELKPNSTEKISFAFSVRYPKKYTIPGL